MTHLDAARRCPAFRAIARPQARDRLPWPLAGLAIAMLALLAWGAALVIGWALFN